MNCIDCGKVLGETAKSHGTKRCYPCSAKARRLPRPLCLDCGKPLAKLGSKRCRGCQTKITWTGRRISVEAKEKIRQANMGKHPAEATRAKLRGRIQSVETRERNRIAHLGEKNHKWKGGKGNERHRVQFLSGYRAWRKAVFERDDYTCHFCKVRGGTLNAHHILPFSTHPKQRLNIDNGITLCEPCHRNI